MRGTKAKAIRRQVYGDISIRPPRHLSGHKLAQALNILAEFKKIYRRFKRSYRDGACGILIVRQGQ